MFVTSFSAQCLKILFLFVLLTTRCCATNPATYNKDSRCFNDNATAIAAPLPVPNKRACAVLCSQKPSCPLFTVLSNNNGYTCTLYSNMTYSYYLATSVSVNSNSNCATYLSDVWDCEYSSWQRGNKRYYYYTAGLSGNQALAKCASQKHKLLKIDSPAEATWLNTVLLPSIGRGYYFTSLYGNYYSGSLTWRSDQTTITTTSLGVTWGIDGCCGTSPYYCYMFYDTGTNGGLADHSCTDTTYSYICTCTGV